MPNSFKDFVTNGDGSRPLARIVAGDRQWHRQRFKSCFCKLLGQLATETLAFYGQDFQVKVYPDFDVI